MNPRQSVGPQDSYFTQSPSFLAQQKAMQKDRETVPDSLGFAFDNPPHLA